jgi:hypothetical protein
VRPSSFLAELFDADLRACLVHRMIEALLDPKTWLFALFSALDNVPNRYVAPHFSLIARLTCILR